MLLPRYLFITPLKGQVHCFFFWFDMQKSARSLSLSFKHDLILLRVSVRGTLGLESAFFTVENILEPDYYQPQQKELDKEYLTRNVNTR